MFTSRNIVGVQRNAFHHQCVKVLQIYMIQINTVLVHGTVYGHSSVKYIQPQRIYMHTDIQSVA